MTVILIDSGGTVVDPLAQRQQDWRGTGQAQRHIRPGTSWFSPMLGQAKSSRDVLPKGFPAFYRNANNLLGIARCAFDQARSGSHSQNSERLEHNGPGLPRPAERACGRPPGTPEPRAASAPRPV